MIYVISNFTRGPHADVAYIEAENEPAARAILEAKLAPMIDYEDEADVMGGTWVDVEPEEDWIVGALQGPLSFVLTAGCR